MIEFTRTINKAEVNSYYLNLTDNYGNCHGSKFPPDKTPLYVVTDGRQYKASKRGENQIWGSLRIWYCEENVRAGDTVCIRYDSSAPRIDGRAVIEIFVTERLEGPKAEIPTEPVNEEEEALELEEAPAEISLQMERELEDFLVENLTLIEDGLKLYTDERGQSGRHYPTDVGVVDLLCNKGAELVVIELKKGRSSDAVVGQISRYMGWVKQNLAEASNVRGIIIVHDYDPKLAYAVSAHDKLLVKYYEIQIRFIPEDEAIKRSCQ